MLLKERAGEGQFGAFLPQHIILRRRQQLAPLRVGMGDFVGMCRRGRGVRPRQTENGKPQARGAGVEDMSACEHIVPPKRASRPAALRE